MKQAGLAVVVCWQSEELSVIEYASPESYPTNLQNNTTVSYSNRLVLQGSNDIHLTPTEGSFILVP